MDNKSIQIYVALNHMGNVTKKVKEYLFLLGKTPRTFRELIEESGNPSETPAMWVNDAYPASSGTIYFAVQR